MVNTRFPQLLVSLRGEDIATNRITSTMLKILKEGTPGLIEQVDIAEYATCFTRKNMVTPICLCS